MNTPRTDAIEVCAYYADDMRHMIVSAEDYVAMTELSQQLETEVQELRAALEVAVVSHRNLYKATFGEKSDPHNDGVFTQMCAALAKVPK